MSSLKNFDTAIYITDPREAALYFDTVLPMTFGWQSVTNYSRLSEESEWLEMEKISEIRLRFAKLIWQSYEKFVFGTFEKKFNEKLFVLLGREFYSLVGEIAKYSDKEKIDLEEATIKFSTGFINNNLLDESNHEINMKYVALCAKSIIGYSNMKLLRKNTIIVDEFSSIYESPDSHDNIGTILSNLNLIDVENISIEKIREFRKDKGAMMRLRALRLFSLNNYKGKEVEFVENYISRRLDEYDSTVKDWNFETKTGAVSMMLNSKTLAGGMGGSLISALAGAPIASLLSAGTGILFESANIALEVYKRNSKINNILSNNPMSYIKYAKSSLK